MNTFPRLAAFALTVSTVASGCAFGQPSDCLDIACEQAATQPAEATTLADSASAAVAVEQPSSDAVLRIAALQQWVMRIADGEEDVCDDRFYGSFETSDSVLDLGDCETSFVRRFVSGEAVAIVAMADDPLMLDEVAPGRFFELAPLTFDETQWMRLGLAVGGEAPLSLAQELMLAEADRVRVRRVERMTIHAIDNREPPFDAVVR